MEGLPASLAKRLQKLTYSERAVAYLQVDAALTLVGAGGYLENYGLAAMRLGEPVVGQAYFLEWLLPLEESPYFVPSVELDCGRAADLHLHLLLDGGTVWVVLFDVTVYRDATRRLQQKAYEMTLLQEKEALLNRRLEPANVALGAANRELEASNDFLARISKKISHYIAPQIYKSIFRRSRNQGRPGGRQSLPQHGDGDAAPPGRAQCQMARRWYGAWTIRPSEPRLISRRVSNRSPIPDISSSAYETYALAYETYALVRDIVAARALPEISVKGVSRKVVPYVIEGVLDEAGRKIEIFSEHMTGLDFYLDPRAVDAAAIERIRETLRNAIAALERLGVDDAPGQ